jgi:hypothetical protein
LGGLWHSLSKFLQMGLRLGDKFHSPKHYDVGPYKPTKEYALAYHDKEIYYYTHASDEDIR